MDDDLAGPGKGSSSSNDLYIDAKHNLVLVKAVPDQMSSSLIQTRPSKGILV